MTDEDNSKKSGLNYILLVGILLVVVIALFLVPFAAIGMALKKSGCFGKFQELQSAVAEATTADKEAVARTLDISTLRTTLEKAAAAALKVPEVAFTSVRQVQIEPSNQSITKTKDAVGQLLVQNHHQYVEAVDPDQIRLIVILKSKEWPALAAQLMEAADKDGFVYKGPSQTASAGEADTVMAEIEIHKKK